MDVGYPFGFDGRGRTGDASETRHVRDLIEQVLFTSPGERVNRPDFGSGVLRLVFAPNGDVLASATQATVLGALQTWLGDRIQVEGVVVEHDDAVLRISVQYMIRASQQREVTLFTRAVSS